MSGFQADLIRKCTPISGNYKKDIYELPLEEVCKDSSNNVRKCQLGLKPLHSAVLRQKVILLVGATGTGKTTIINGMINFILGVEWDDKFRFKLIVDPDEKTGQSQAVSQTRWVSAYTLHRNTNHKIQYTVTIIDTPGFGDTRGLEYDKETVTKISNFFKNDDGIEIDHVNAVCFVVKASDARLSHSQKFVFHSILSLFGKDIGRSIFLMMTFADGHKAPVLSAIEEAKIPYAKKFKFNNSALFSNTDDDSVDDDTDEFDLMFWKMGMKSFDTFFETLRSTDNVSLQLTKSVLDQREHLETLLTGFQTQLQSGLVKLAKLKREIEVVKQHESEINRNKDFTYTVVEVVAKREAIKTGEYTTTCMKCNFTCHHTCSYSNDAEKMKCSSMDPTGYCEVCPGHCIWSVHRNTPFRLVTEQNPVQKTSKDLKDRYEKALNEKQVAESLVSEVVKDFDSLQLNTLWLMDNIRKCVMRLDEIALKPNPLSAVEYIDLLIQSEEIEHKAGWIERVEQLKLARQQAEMLYNVADVDYDPFDGYIDANEHYIPNDRKNMQRLRNSFKKLNIKGWKSSCSQFFGLE